VRRIANDRRDVPQPPVHFGSQAANFGRSTVHSCGGCGAGFLVDPFVAAVAVDLDGTAREFCACCQEFLGERLPSVELAFTPGYDAEGQAVNARFPHLTPTERRQHRAGDTQFLLATVIRANAVRLGVTPPDPLFLAS
jgi:hypothetical protein